MQNKTSNRQVEVLLQLLKQAQWGPAAMGQPGMSVVPIIPPVPYPIPIPPLQLPPVQPNLPKQTLPKIVPETPPQTNQNPPVQAPSQASSSVPDILQYLQGTSKESSSGSNFDLSSLTQYLKDPRVIVPLLTFAITMGIERATREDGKSNWLMPIVFTLLSVLGTQAYHAMTHPEDRINDLLKKYLGFDLTSLFSDEGKEVPREIPRPRDVPREIPREMPREVPRMVPDIPEHRGRGSDTNTIQDRYGIGPLTTLGVLGGLTLPQVNAYYEARNKAITRALDRMMARIGQAAPDLKGLLHARGLRRILEEGAFGDTSVGTGPQHNYRHILEENLEDVYSALNPNAARIPRIDNLEALARRITNPGRRLQLRNLENILNNANEELRYLYKKEMPTVPRTGLGGFIVPPIAGGVVGYLLDAAIRNLFPYS